MAGEVVGVVESWFSASGRFGQQTSFFKKIYIDKSFP
jgi:hypothetical protein